MGKPNVLIQLDGDPHASSFDAVVAVDAGVDHLLQYHAVAPAQVRSLVHGAIFTRGPKDLSSTAIFVGGSDVGHAEELVREVLATFFGPMRVSVMMDANGANTTAAAAVLSVTRHLELAGQPVAVMAATGSVGQRVSRLLARQGAAVRVGSRSAQRAAAVCDEIRTAIPDAILEPWACDGADAVERLLAGAAAVIAAGAPGIKLLSQPALTSTNDLRVAVDLNAVPPLGIEGVEVTDAAADRNGVTCYGAIGVGGTKMKIHKAALRALFDANDRVLNAEEVFELGAQLDSG